ncbi:MAG: SEC-C domain-containing protein [Candidatus Lindowbacteria bacterium]|nr:SEC-C domain-containing protein [Candidatus Lindowbacteria bacterium]
MTTVGRNEPCPCGSGKKYKKCCMLKESAVDLNEYRQKRSEESLRSEILRFATGERFKEEMVEAFRKYHRDKIDTGLLLKQDPLENIRFLDWFINEHADSKSNKRIIDLFGELRAKHLEDDQGKLLEEWKASRMSAFEVQATDAGVLKLADIFYENSDSIEDQSACDEVKAGEILVVRITSSWGKKELAGAPITLAAEKKQKLIDALNGEFEKYRGEHPDADLRKFLSENKHLLNAFALELATAS